MGTLNKHARPQQVGLPCAWSGAADVDAGDGSGLRQEDYSAAGAGLGVGPVPDPDTRDVCDVHGI